MPKTEPGTTLSGRREPDAAVLQLLHEVDGLLGLAVHRGEGPHLPAWKEEASQLIGRIRQLTDPRR